MSSIRTIHKISPKQFETLSESVKGIGKGRAELKRGSKTNANWFFFLVKGKLIGVTVQRTVDDLDYRHLMFELAQRYPRIGRLFIESDVVEKIELD